MEPLTSTQEKVLKLYVYLSMTRAEIARELNYHIGTINYHFDQIHAKLRPSYRAGSLAYLGFLYGYLTVEEGEKWISSGVHSASSITTA